MERLSWIPLSNRKGIPLPNVMVEKYSNQNYGGYYTPDGSNTLVCVIRADDLLEKQLRASIAHEFAHHEQFHRNQNMWPKVGSNRYLHLPYEEMIKVYFRTQKHEMEALLFEYKVAKSELNDWWLNHLVKPNRKK